MKLKNRIFHIMTISLLILSAVLLSACGKQETAGSMKLTKAELSHKEKALADLRPVYLTSPWMRPSGRLRSPRMS